MAPPRMLPGFIDAGLAFGPDPYSIAGSDSANQFAAMPSMHVAWAILASYAIWQLSTNHIARAVAIVHPILTSLVVILTGHHFVSDVAIGAALAVLCLGISIGARRTPARTVSTPTKQLTAVARPSTPCHSASTRRASMRPAAITEG